MLLLAVEDENKLGIEVGKLPDTIDSMLRISTPEVNHVL